MMKNQYKKWVSTIPVYRKQIMPEKESNLRQGSTALPSTIKGWTHSRTKKKKRREQGGSGEKRQQAGAVARYGQKVKAI